MRLEKALSEGANMVKPLFVFMSCELIWLDTWVVFKRRIRVVNPPAFFRILMMSVGGDDGDGAGEACAGEAGAGVVVGAAAGDWAEVVEE